MRVAINLLPEHPDHPSGAHWFWTRVIPEVARRMEPGEELALLVSPRSQRLHQGYGPAVSYMTYPWSNERRVLRTLAENLYSPVRLPLGGVDVFNTLMAPVVPVPPSLVVHIKTMHAVHRPRVAHPAGQRHRRMNYPRSAKVAEAIIINSESLRSEVERYLEIDKAKLQLIYEAVDHDLFRPGDAAAARAKVAARGVTKPFVLFVSSLWPYKRTATGCLRAVETVARPELDGTASSPLLGPDATRRTSPNCTPSRPTSASRAMRRLPSAGCRSTRRSTSTGLA